MQALITKLYKPTELQCMVSKNKNMGIQKLMTTKNTAFVQAIRFPKTSNCID